MIFGEDEGLYSLNDIANLHKGEKSTFYVKDRKNSNSYQLDLFKSPNGQISLFSRPIGKVLDL